VVLPGWRDRAEELKEAIMEELKEYWENPRVLISMTRS